MKVFFRNFPEIQREKFLTQEAYDNAVKKQNSEITKYKSTVRVTINIVALFIIISIISLIVLGGVKLYNRVAKSSSDFDVVSTVLNERNVKLDKEKLYNNELQKVKEELVVCIDPGHGGEELGETLTNEDGKVIRSEKFDNMELGILIQEKLQDYGVKVVMTRTGDTKHNNSERCAIANEANADVMISLHRNNEATNKNRKGVELYTPTAKSAGSDVAFTTANYIMGYLSASGISANGGVHVGSITSEIHDFQINRESNMPSIILELGYISNEEDNVLFDLNMERYATAITYGILKNFAPECIINNSELTGVAQNNNLIFDYESLDNKSISYTVNSDNPENFNTYLNQITAIDEKYDSSSAEFIKQNDNNEVYLTFDVGSDAGNTKKILEILKDNKVKATFFINYTFAVNHPDLVRDIISNGHVLANGSKDFPSEGIPLLDEEEQLSQIVELHEYVLYNYNHCMSLFRFPNGIFSERLLAIVNNYHYKSVFWSYSFNDYTDLCFEKEDVLSSMYAGLNSGVIYTLRTDSDIDLQVLDEFIKTSQSKGFVFGKLN